MKVRILSAVIASALALSILFLPVLLLSELAAQVILSAALAVLNTVAVHELLSATGVTGHRAVTVWSMLFAAMAPFFPFLPLPIVLTAIAVYAFSMIFMQVLCHGALTVERTCMAFLLTLFASTGFASIAYLRSHDEHGMFYLFFVMVVAWLSDTGAYFVGTFCGKHKMCPKISPKKTWEGFIGGMLFSVGCVLLTAWIYENICGLDGISLRSWVLIAVGALVCAPLSVLGDLFASIIKRQFQVKDYGKIMPGHGGVMDRFDSLLMVAPVVYVALVFMEYLF